MTKQIHPYVRECEQFRKMLIRSHRNGKHIPHHTRKWWTAWHKRYKAEQLKEKENDI